MNKRTVELEYKTDPANLEKVHTTYDEIAYVRKDRKPDHMIPMYHLNGRAVVTVRHTHGKPCWRPEMLHPDNICQHDESHWRTLTSPFDGATYRRCITCTPSYFEEEQ